MNWIKGNIPNFFTLLNLSLGIIAIDLVLTSDPTEKPIVHYYVLLAGVCDLLDGLLARKLKVQSEFGLQLDSLADLITFGVLPIFIYASIFPLEGIGFLLILVPICSAIRLAIFNLDTDQKSSFKGISTTAHGIFVATLPIILYQNNSWFGKFVNTQPETIIAIAVFFSFLMVSSVRMISFKFENFALKENWQRYLLLCSSIILVVIMKYNAAPLIMLIYILLSVISNFSPSIDKAKA